MLTFHISLLPPSVNHLYGRRAGRTFKTDEGKAFMEVAYYDLFKSRPKKPIDKPCRVDLIFTFTCQGDIDAGDVDNLLKCTFDALQKGRLVKNDSLIYKASQEKRLGRREGIDGTLTLIE